MKVLAVTIRVKADKIEEARGFFRQFLALSLGFQSGMETGQRNLYFQYASYRRYD